MSGQEEPEIVSDFDRLNKARVLAQSLAGALRDHNLAEAAAQIAVLLDALEYEPGRAGSSGRYSSLDVVGGVIRDHIVTSLTLMTTPDDRGDGPEIIWSAEDAIDGVRTFWSNYPLAVVEDAISSWSAQVAA